MNRSCEDTLAALAAGEPLDSHGQQHIDLCPACAILACSSERIQRGNETHAAGEIPVSIDGPHAAGEIPVIIDGPQTRGTSERRARQRRKRMSTRVAAVALSALTATGLGVWLPGALSERRGAHVRPSRTNAPAVRGAADEEVMDTDARRAERELLAEIHTSSEELRAAIAATRPDKARITSLIDRISELEARAHKKRILSYLEARELLDAHQGERLDSSPLALVVPTPAARRERTHAQHPQERGTALSRPDLARLSEQVSREVERAREKAQRAREQARRARQQVRLARDRVQRAREKAWSDTRPGADARVPAAGSLVIAAAHGARILVDGKLQGTAPLCLELLAGVHEITVETPGAAPYQRAVRIKPGRTRTLSVPGRG